jgi:hypothetical protein
MNATTGARDKSKTDDAAAVVTTMEHGPLPPASFYPCPPFGIGKVRFVLYVLYMLMCVDGPSRSILINSARPPFGEVIVHRETSCESLLTRN